MAESPSVSRYNFPHYFLPGVLMARVLLPVLLAIAGLVGCEKKPEPPAVAEPRRAEPPKPESPKPELPPQGKTFLPPTKVLPVDLVSVLDWSLSPDGGTIGLAGRRKQADGSPGDHVSTFYDATTGRPVGVPIDVFGPGMMSRGGKTAAYGEVTNSRVRTSADPFVVHVRDIITGQEFDGDRADTADHFALSPDGKLLVVAVGSKLRFLALPSRLPVAPDADLGSPVAALSGVFQNGTRVVALLDTAGGVVARVWDVKANRAADEFPLGRPKLKTAHPSEWVLVAEDGKAMVVDGEEHADVWDLTTKTRPAWARIMVSHNVLPVPGGRVSYIDQVADGHPSAGNSFVAVADLATGRAVHQLLYPEPDVLDLWMRAEVSTDGTRFVSLIDPTHRIYVWDVPK